jgi:hypothetical protein
MAKKQIETAQRLQLLLWQKAVAKSAPQAPDAVFPADLFPFVAATTNI